MEARSANVSMPGVEGCLLVRAASPEDVLLALIRIPKAAGLMADAVGAAFWACTTAVCGRVEGGRVVWASGEG